MAPLIIVKWQRYIILACRFGWWQRLSKLRLKWLIIPTEECYRLSSQAGLSSVVCLPRRVTGSRTLGSADLYNVIQETVLDAWPWTIRGLGLATGNCSHVMIDQISVPAILWMHFALWTGGFVFLKSNEGITSWSKLQSNASVRVLSTDNWNAMRACRIVRNSYWYEQFSYHFGLYLYSLVFGPGK